MAELVPVIHVFLTAVKGKAWMPATAPGHDSAIGQTSIPAEDPDQLALDAHPVRRQDPHLI